MANPNSVRGRNYPKISKAHIDETRARIAAHGLITRLQDFALGEMFLQPDLDGTFKAMVRLEDGKVKPAMTKEQVAAATKLLSFVLPTLQSVEVKSDETKTFVLRAPAPAKDAKEWLDNYAPKVIEHKETRQ